MKQAIDEWGVIGNSMELQTQGVETLFNPSVPSSTPPLSSQQGILRLIAHYRRKSSWARSDDHRQSRFAHVQNVLRSHNAFRVYYANGIVG